SIENKRPLFLLSKENITLSDEQIQTARSGKTPRGAKIIRASGLRKKKGKAPHIEVLPGDYIEPGQLLCEITNEKDDSEGGRMRGPIKKSYAEMKRLEAKTFGEMMFNLYEQRCFQANSKKRGEIRNPIRNRKNASGEAVYEFCADRKMMQDEFVLLWSTQKEFDSELSKLLTSDLLKQLFDPRGDKTWKQKGLIFGQRNFYWNIGTLGRCDLEPTDQQCPKPDMYAQEFLVLETLNNIRITPPGEVSRPLDDQERQKVLELFQTQKSIKAGAVRRVLGINRGENKTLYSLSLDADPNRSLNANWFVREIIIKAIGQSQWETYDEKTTESINSALLKYDPENLKHEEKLFQGSQEWWNLTEEQAQKLVNAWKHRPRKDERVNLSRKAIKNLLPYMREGYSVTEARQLFAEDGESGASDEQRQRYALISKRSNKKMRHYLDKHPDRLPPAPMLANPVVRKSIHEVRNHIQAYLNIFGSKPDRIVVELVRQAKQTAKDRSEQLTRNRKREEERKKIIKKYELNRLTKNQREKAIKRVLLCREQKFISAYSDRPISEKNAAEGVGLEIDHIIPKSKRGPDALVNRLLCYEEENRGKTSKTLKEWLTEEEFGRLEQRLRHLKDDNPVKWDYLHKDVKDIAGFTDSQKIDTAYATLQVTSWLRDTLYGGEVDGKRRVFATKGSYTNEIRRDLGLFPDTKAGTAGEKKNRLDHRHHALDAVVIALSGPEQLARLAKKYEKVEEEKSNGYSTAKPEPLAPPWGTLESFRADVMKEYDKLVVSHRPAGRKLTGQLHNDTQLGPVMKDGEVDTKHCKKRIFAIELTPNHLRVPDEWDRLRKQLEKAVSKSEKKAIRSRMLNLEDVKPAKSGVVRDRWFREELREYLRGHGLNVDDCREQNKKEFKKQIKELIKAKGIFLKSGVPVRRITLLRSPTMTPPIKRKYWNVETGKMEDNTNPKSVRLYEPQSNHHIEIREDTKGKWKGEVITNFGAAQRVKPSKASGRKPQPMVNRKDNPDGKFVMSLSIGEMVYMKHPDTKEPDYFVVFKIDGTGRIHFTPHYDAGRSKATETCAARQDIPLSARQLQELGVEEGKGSYKVWVGPLGDIKKLNRD
ncbi:type II CRISPR RNA-guided endonuclease Cas9, partial [candidate division Kazan bacterium]